MRRYPNIFGKISKYYQIFLHIVLILNIYKLTGTAWLAVSPDHLVVLVPGSSGTPESVRVLPGALVVRLVLVHEWKVARQTLHSPANTNFGRYLALFMMVLRNVVILR